MLLIKISIIIPVYNMEKYLAEALNSAIKQSLKDIEIICIDDGSDDNSKVILTEYANKDSRIKVISTENQGAGKARNRGISIARGEFICFLDADDFFYDEDALKSLYDAARKNDAMVCGGGGCIYKQGEIVVENQEQMQKMVFQTGGIIAFEDYQWPYCYWRYIYNRNMLVKNGLYFPDYRRYQDPPFLVNVMSYCKKFMAIDKITYCYRKEYKRIEWTEEKLFDVLKGERDVLFIAGRMGWGKLYIDSLKKLHANRTSYTIAKQNENVLRIVEDINNNLKTNINILQNYDIKYEDAFLDVDKITQTVKDAVEYETLLVDKLEASRGVILYGAGTIAQRVVSYISGRKRINIIGLAVSDGQKKKDDINGITIYYISELLKYKDDADVLVATRKKYQKEIKNNLENLGFKRIILLDNQQFKRFL